MSLPVEAGAFRDSLFVRSAGDLPASQIEAVLKARQQAAQAAGAIATEQFGMQLELPLGNGDPTLFDPTELSEA